MKANMLTGQKRLITLLKVVFITFTGLVLFCFSGCKSDDGNDGDGDDILDFSRFLSVNSNTFDPDITLTGANLDPWRFITELNGLPYEVYSKDEIREIVKNAIDYTGAEVIRMHINGGAFEPTVGTYNENAFLHLDYLVAAAVEYGAYVLICLRDYCWSPWPPGEDGDYDPYWYLNGGTPAAPKKDNILNHEPAKEYFKDFISCVLNRNNTITNVVYKDETHIMGWELINEPNVIIGTTGPWLEEMADYVLSMDPNHLISFGIGGVEMSWWDTGSPNWDEIDIPQLDFIDIHYYADHTLYEDPIDTANIQKIRDRINSVKGLNKVPVVGEFGCTNEKPLQTILNLYETVMDTAIEEGARSLMPYSWGPVGPQGNGGLGSFNMYTDDTEICELLRSY
jgi:endo-1,4-beta-mannosidase